MRKRIGAALVVGVAVVLVVLVFYPPLVLVDIDGYQTGTVTIHDDNGTVLGTVDVRIADTAAKRRVGLSRTDSLANGSGMLFVHPSEGRQSYVMRDMSFAIDIVFVAKNGTVTRIHRDASPELIAISRYRGRGKYVLEVPAGWASGTGIDPGDSVRIPDTVTAKSG